MDNAQRNFLDSASEAAENAGHIFPTMAACEAALESGYGTSGLARSDNNLFGMKQHKHPVYGTHNLPTREFVGIAKEQEAGVKDGKLDGWITEVAAWVSYPSWKECFVDRMETLRRLAPTFRNYANALAATDCISYVKCVSATWATDPERADKVIRIYNAYMGG